MVPYRVIDVLSSILLSAVVLLVLAGNTLVVLAVATSRKLRTVTNIFIVNLACADLLLGMLILPSSAVLEIKDVWVFGQIWCQIWLAVDVWLCTASILNLCCISFDRYLAITRPIRYPGIMSSRRAKTLVAGVWLFSFIIGCPPLIGWNDTPETGDNETTIIPYVTTSTAATTEATHVNCESEMQVSNSGSNNESCTGYSDFDFMVTCELTNSRGYRIYAALGSFFVPMLVMVFFYLQIYRAAVRTISAYEKGELKAKCSGKEKVSGHRDNSVTLRIHRGGRSFSNRGSECGSVLGSVRGSTTSTVQRDEIIEGDGRRMERGDVVVANSFVKKARGSNASIVTLTEMACKTGDNEIAKRSSLSETAQKSSKPMCWNTERRCLECNKHNIYSDGGQNGRAPRTKLLGKRCMSVDSDESSSSDTKWRVRHIGDHEGASLHNSLPVTTTSTSCQTAESGIIFNRNASTNEHKHRRSRFSAHNPVNAMKLHMQKFNREKKAAKTLAIIVGAFIICWMPFFTTYLVGAFCDSCISPLIFSVAFWLGYCNSAMNPLVYALFSRDFRFAFRRLVMCGCEMWQKSRSLRLHNSDVPAIQLHCAPQDDARSSSDIDGQWR